MEIILKDVRLSYPDLFKPGRPPKDKPNEAGKYGAHAIFAPDSPNAKLVKDAIFAEAQRVFGANWQTILGSLTKDKKCLRDGNQNLTGDGNIRDGYAGMLYVVSKNKLKPIIIDRNPQVHLNEASGKPYGGCYVNMKIDVYAMDGSAKGFGKSVNASLLAVQFLRDGDAFGGSMPNAEGFENLGEPDDAFGGIPAGAQSGTVDPLFGV
jgi:hypothetical protein